MRRIVLVAVLLAASVCGTRVIGAQQAVKSDLPDSLVQRAKISEATARQFAASRVAKGTLTAVELEREHGHLQYSYELTVPGQAGITEVNVDAVTGKVLGVHTESAASEAKEETEQAKPKP